MGAGEAGKRRSEHANVQRAIKKPPKNMPAACRRRQGIPALTGALAECAGVPGGAPVEVRCTPAGGTRKGAGRREGNEE